MSESAARAALERMNLREVAIAPFYAGLAADLHAMAATDPKKGHEDFMARRAELCAAYGYTGQTQNKPFAFANGLAVIPVSGSLINRFGGSWSSVTGYNFIRSQMAAAEADADVLGIVFDLNSYGGEAAGCFELSADIAALSKPTLGVIDSNCYSACYAIGSAMDKLVITPSGGAGSIGVVAMHASFEKMLSDSGIKVTFIYSGDHKVDGNPYMDLPDSVRKDIQAGVDKSRQAFAALVADNRSLDVKAVLDTEARTYRADDALRLGLVDAIATPTEAVQAFLSGLSGSRSTTVKGTSMTTKTQEPGGDTSAADQAALQKAASDARTAERARMSGIQGCDEAKGREKLANHLAMNTDMSVDAAKAILAASPKAEAATPKAEVSAVNPFQAAMDATPNPKVGADGAKGDGETLSVAQQILRDQAAATGMKFDAKA
jgi:capsid assembly protease